MLLDLQRDDIQPEYDTWSVHYLWQECAQYKNSESKTTDAVRKSEPLVLNRFDPFDLFCLISLVTWLQYMGEIYIYIFVCD